MFWWHFSSGGSAEGTCKKFLCVVIVFFMQTLSLCKHVKSYEFKPKANHKRKKKLTEREKMIRKRVLRKKKFMHITWKLSDFIRLRGSTKSLRDLKLWIKFDVEWVRKWWWGEERDKIDNEKVSTQLFFSQLNNFQFPAHNVSGFASERRDMKSLWLSEENWFQIQIDQLKSLEFHYESLSGSPLKRVFVIFQETQKTFERE